MDSLRRHFFDYSLDTFLKNLLQHICHTLSRLDGCYHQQFRIHIGKADVITGVADELRQEGTLGSAVALTERVEGVGDAIEVYNFLNELTVGQSLEIVALFETLENQLCLVLDIFGRRELGTFLTDVHSADFTGPVIQVREKKSVNGFIVFEVKYSGLRRTQPFSISGRGEDALDLIQLFFVLNIKLVNENRGIWVAVCGDRVNTVSHITPPLQDGPGSPLQGRPRTLRRS